MNRNIAIITGASGGLGKEFAKLVINKNFDEIWCIARNQEKLNSLKNELGEKIKIFSYDLSDINEIKNFQKFLQEQNVTISLLINNAGYGKFGAYDDISLDDSVNMINLNINGVVAMGLVCIPYMQKNSHIINIASQASFQPLPYLNIYAATKVFVKNYSKALNIELKNKGITVTAVCPTWMQTGFFERSNTGSKKSPTIFAGMVKTKDVAKKALKDAYKNKNVSIYGIHIKLYSIIAKIFPENLIMKMWLFLQKLNKYSH